MTDVTHKRGGETKDRRLRSFLFFSNWLFVVFLSKRLISPPAGGLDFVVKNIGTFLVAWVMTDLMIYFSPKKVIIVLIPTMVILALAIAVT